jgi:hypothetical protein
MAAGTGMRNHGCRRNGLTAVSHLRETGQRASAPQQKKAGARHPRAPRPEATTTSKEASVRNLLRFRGPFRSLFGTSRREHYLERYVLREHRKGRPLAEILDDPYIRAWSTQEERARLLERPSVVAAIGEQALADLRTTIAGSGLAV